MEIEVREMASEKQPAMKKKLKSYHSQLDTLQKEFVSFVSSNNLVNGRPLKCMLCLFF